MGRKRIWENGKGKQRIIYISGGTEAGLTYQLRLPVYRNGSVQAIYFRLQDISDRKKQRIRYKDRIWVASNIPSSLWWGKEIHHDWEDGGKMYLLTKGEHLEREKWIRKQKKESKNV